MKTAVTLKAIIVAAVSFSMPAILMADNLLINGDFEQTVEISTDADRQRYLVEGWELGSEHPRLPSGWALHHAHKGRLTLVEKDVKSGSLACMVEGGGWIHAGFPVNSDAGLNVTFWAKGDGKVRMMLFQYETDSTGSVIQFLETVELETIQLGGEWKEYKIAHQFSIPAVNRADIAFDVQGMAVLDAVDIQEHGMD
jgi:hypothetical protein